MKSRQKDIAYDTNEHGCHICTSHKTGVGGYPVGHGGETIVKRLWVKKHGTVPKGLVMRHTCDNPACINVDHIVLGTNAENSKDMVERGRSLKAEKNPQAVLTWEIVNTIRADKITPNTVLGRRLGVHHSTISAIRLHKIW